MMRRLTAVLVLVLLLIVPACSAVRSAEGPATATVPTPTVGGEQAATINRILAGLDGVMGDLERALVRDRRITAEVTDRLRAIYTGPELLSQVDAFRADLANGLVGYKDPPGNRVTTVSRLITVSQICIFAEVTRDYGPTTAGPPPRPASLYVVLVTKDETDDPKHLNPTPWAMLYDGVQNDGSQPDDACR